MDCSTPGSSVQHLCKSLFLELRSALLLQPPDWGSSGQGAACSSGLWPGLPGTGQTGLAGADGCFAASGAQVPGDLCHSVPHKSCRQPHATARPHLEGMTSPSGPGHNLVWVSVCPKQTARSQKTAQLLLPTTTQVTRQMASSAWPASSGWLPVPELTGWPAKRSCVSPMSIPDAASVPCRVCLPFPLPPHHLLRCTCAPSSTKADHAVKNRASLLVPISLGTRCSHKLAGWQGLLGRRAGPEPGLLGTDTEKNE